MKNLLLLFVAALLSISAYAQEIPAKANTIIITLPDSATASEKVMKVLNNKDYTIPKAPKGSEPIKTGGKTLKNNTRVGLIADIKGAEVILTGKILQAAQGSLPIEYKGTKGTPIMIAWEEMDKVAKALGGTVKYEVR